MQQWPEHSQIHENYNKKNKATINKYKTQPPRKSDYLLFPSYLELNLAIASYRNRLLNSPFASRHNWLYECVSANQKLFRGKIILWKNHIYYNAIILWFQLKLEVQWSTKKSNSSSLGTSSYSIWKRNDSMKI